MYWVGTCWPAYFWNAKVWLIKIFSYVRRVIFCRWVCRVVWFKQVFSFFHQGEGFGWKCIFNLFFQQGFFPSTFLWEFRWFSCFKGRAAIYVFRFLRLWVWLIRDVFSWVLIIFLVFLLIGLAFRVFIFLRVFSVVLLCAFGCFCFSEFSIWRILDVTIQSVALVGS